MRLFRVIVKKEKDALLENGDTLKPHKTCKVPDWILNQHPEDYETGKYFFFELEDVLKYAKETYGSSKECSLLEIDIDENLILPYLGYGVYCYPDYEEDGMWDNNLSHCIPEVLLPYHVVDKAIKTTSYKLTDIDNKALLKFYAPYTKERSKELINLGNIVSKICCAKCSAEYTNPELNNTRCMQYTMLDYEKAKQKVRQLELLLPPIYEKFIESHRNYNSQLNDFINVSEFEKDSLVK